MAPRAGAVLAPVTESMTTRDGVRLDADVHRPAAPGTYPVLLMRQPYGRRIASTVCYAHPSWYAAHGYIVVVQDVRGRGTSQGAFRLFADEAADGAEAVAWAAGLDGSTGAVGMYGFSHQGVTQLLAAAGDAPALKAIAPAMIGWDLRNDWAWENGAFNLSANLAWAVQIAAETARLAGDLHAHQALYAASRALPLTDAAPARPGLMDAYARYAPHYRDWLDQPEGSSYWAGVSPHVHAETLTGQGPPALFVGGWNDPHLPGTVDAYRTYEAAGGAPARLVVGPWGHFPWGRRSGAIDFGEDAVGEIDQLQVRWFDRWLKGAAADDGPPVRLFDMGRRSWREFAAWPTETVAWALGGRPEARVALDERDGLLDPQGRGGPGDDPLVHDPWRPVPTAGGAFGLPGGWVDRTAVDARPDVLTYTSPALEAGFSLAGTPEVLLDVVADSPSFDLSCILSRVDGQGRAVHLTEGYRHFPTGPGPAPALVRLRPTCVTLQPGERLRLAVAGSAFPAHPVNPGDGRPPTDARLGEHRVITLTVRRDGRGSCLLRLPVAEAPR